MWFLAKGAENQIEVVVLPSSWLFGDEALQSGAHLWSLQEKRMLKIWSNQATAVSDSVVILPPRENVFYLFKGALGCWIINAKTGWEFLIRGFFYFSHSRQQPNMILWLAAEARRIQNGKKHHILALKQLTKGWTCFFPIWDFKVTVGCLSSSFFF